MVVCKYCNRDMLKADGCFEICIETERGNLRPIKFGNEKRYGDINNLERCHDCNCKVGEFHHPGCDWEECPACGLQLISCGCLEDREEDD